MSGKEILVPEIFVMAFDKARADETPFPPPDMSSPNSSLENLSFNISSSEPEATKKIYIYMQRGEIRLTEKSFNR